MSTRERTREKRGIKMVKCPENELIEITKGELLSKCMEMKKSGLRFSQG